MHRTIDSLMSGGAGDRRTAVLLGVIGAVAACIGSWHVSLWTDEAVTASVASRDLRSIWKLTGHIDAVHSAYYTFMHVWVSWFGTSPFSLRLPSAFAAGFTVAGTFALGRMLVGAGTGVLAALVMVFLPRATWMGIEARSFAFSATVAIWLTVLLVWNLDRPRSKVRTAVWCCYAILAALGIAINLYVALVLCAHGASVLLSRTSWHDRFRWLLSSVLGVGITSPILAFAVGQSGQIAESDLSLTGWVRNIFVNQWFLGATPTGGATSQFPDILWKGLSVILAVVAWSLVVALTISTVRQGRSSRYFALLNWVGCLLIVPTCVIVAYSIFSSPMYNPRYLAFTTPAVALLVGAGLSRFRSPPLRHSALVLVILLAMPIYLSQRTSEAKSGTDWSAAAAYVDRSSSPGDAVYFAPRSPSESDVNEQTTRRIEAAYPDAFADLIDVTLMSTGVEDTSIDGLSRTLQDRQDVLDRVEKVFLIAHRSYPGFALSDDEATLSLAGFDRTAVWEGSLTRILVFAR